MFFISLKRGKNALKPISFNVHIIKFIFLTSQIKFDPNGFYLKKGY